MLLTLELKGKRRSENHLGNKKVKNLETLMGAGDTLNGVLASLPLDNRSCEI
jgi:hypothetical protein